jgi:hypothetical protein
MQLRFDRVGADQEDLSRLGHAEVSGNPQPENLPLPGRQLVKQGYQVGLLLGLPDGVSGVNGLIG